MMTRGFQTGNYTPYLWPLAGRAITQKLKMKKLYLRTIFKYQANAVKALLYGYNICWANSATNIVWYNKNSQYEIFLV